MRKMETDTRPNLILENKEKKKVLDMHNIWIGTHLDSIAGNGVHSEQLLKEYLRYVQPIIF